MKTKKIVIFLLLALLAVCLVVTVACSLPVLLRPHPNIAATIAPTLGVAPNIEAINKYLEQNIKPGMTKEEVHKILGMIGSYKIIWDDEKTGGRWDSDTNQYVFYEQLRFIDLDRMEAFGDWGLLYDKNHRLVRGGPMD